MANNVTVAACDGMIDSLNRFDKSVADIAAFLCNSANLACELLNEDDTAVALKVKIGKIAGKMADTMDQTEVMRKALQQTRDDLISMNDNETEE